MKQKQKRLFTVVLIVAFCAGTFFGWILPLILTQAGSNPFAPVVPATTFDTTVYDILDASNDINDDVNRYWYGIDAEGMDSDDISDVVWADLALEDTDDDLDPKADWIYVLKLNLTDMVDRFFTTDVRLFGGQLDALVLGDNNLPLCNQSEDIAELYHTTETGLATFAGATYRTWDINVFFLDAAESATAEVTEKEGYMSYYDPSTDLLNGFGIMIHLNETDALAFSVVGTYSSVAEDVVSDGSVHSMCLINGLFSGHVTIQIRLALAVTDGTADHAVTISGQVGTMAGADGSSTFTTTDTQV
jgi:hypothetical protein